MRPLFFSMLLIAALFCTSSIPSHAQTQVHFGVDLGSPLGEFEGYDGYTEPDRAVGIRLGLTTMTPVNEDSTVYFIYGSSFGASSITNNLSPVVKEVEASGMPGAFTVSQSNFQLFDFSATSYTRAYLSDLVFIGGGFSIGAGYAVAPTTEVEGQTPYELAPESGAFAPVFGFNVGIGLQQVNRIGFHVAYSVFTSSPQWDMETTSNGQVVASDSYDRDITVGGLRLSVLYPL